ncbi:MAG: ABC transporter permease [Acidobacteria bacterium]|nr:ABC transporter permease [Acidobacteriota bacterium]
MFREILRQAWVALTRSPLRSLLTMLGIVWGIVAVALLFAYGAGFRSVLVTAFEAFGNATVVCWPGQTSQQAGGERAGKRVRFEQADVDAVKAESSLIKYACLETGRNYAVSYGERFANDLVRGVCPEYGEMRNEVPSDGRWLSREDSVERRRVVFLGHDVRKKLFAGRPAVGEIVLIGGLRFTVIGSMDKKIQFSNYFSSDDDSLYIPYTTAGDLWDNKYGRVIVATAIAPRFEGQTVKAVRSAVGKRQGFAANDERAVISFGAEEGRVVIDGITIGLQVLLLFIGTLTLGIGGVGVMNIMLCPGRPANPHPVPVPDRGPLPHDDGRSRGNFAVLCPLRGDWTPADAGSALQRRFGKRRHSPQRLAVDRGRLDGGAHPGRPAGRNRSRHPGLAPGPHRSPPLRIRTTTAGRKLRNSQRQCRAY